MGPYKEKDGLYLKVGVSRCQHEPSVTWGGHVGRDSESPSSSEPALQLDKGSLLFWENSPEL